MTEEALHRAALGSRDLFYEGNSDEEKKALKHFKTLFRYLVRQYQAQQGRLALPAKIFEAPARNKSMFKFVLDIKEARPIRVTTGFLQNRNTKSLRLCWTLTGKYPREWWLRRSPASLLVKIQNM